MLLERTETQAGVLVLGWFWFFVLFFFFPQILLLQNKRLSFYILKGKKPHKQKKSQTNKPLGGCVDLLVSFEKSFCFAAAGK